MAAVTGLTVVKRFTYRGDNQEEFSNTYHFKGSPPGDKASWDVLVDDVLTQEKKVFTFTVEFVRAYGYDSDDPAAHHVYTKDWEVPGPPPTGTFVPGSNSTQGAGDQAALVWWKCSRLSARGKPIYLRKYLHQPHMGTGDPDLLESTYTSALGSYADLTNGMGAVHGGLRSQLHDENVVAAGGSPYVTTRTLKRRGKRPRTGS